MNIAVLIGRLTKDPELRYIPTTQRPVATFSIAVDRVFVGKDGQKQTDFFNIVVWGKQAENAANYLGKGSQVAVKGSIQNRSYETPNGEKRYLTEIVAENIQFLSKSNNSSAAKNDNASNPASENANPYFPEELDESGYQMLDDIDTPF